MHAKERGTSVPRLFVTQDAGRLPDPSPVYSTLNACPLWPNTDAHPHTMHLLKHRLRPKTRRDVKQQAPGPSSLPHRLISCIMNICPNSDSRPHKQPTATLLVPCLHDTA